VLPDWSIRGAVPSACSRRMAWTRVLYDLFAHGITFRTPLERYHAPAMASVKKTQKCPLCHGHGKVQCRTCKGEGEIVVAINGKPTKKRAKKEIAGK